MRVLCKPNSKGVKSVKRTISRRKPCQYMKTNNLSTLKFTVISACLLTLAACANKSESPDTERLQIPSAPAAPDTVRLPLPPLPTAQTNTARLRVPTQNAEAPVAQPSIAQTEANAAPVADQSNLPTDPLLANQNQDVVSTAIDDVKKPTAVLPLRPTASTEPTVPAVTNTVATTNIKKRSEQTDDISIITWRAERGHIESQLILGTAYANGTLVEKDPEQARLWLELASMQGDRGAQYELGKMYYSGTGVRRDYLNAREWWIESAISGNDKAQQKLGYLYSEGLGVTQDFNKAKNWYLKAANLGNAEAQTLLGSLYHEGNRIQQDYKEAVKWYRLAARQGHPYAQYTLGILYHDGLGTEADPVKCAAWVEVAKTNGHVDDLGASEACRAKLDEQSLAESNALAEQWKAEYVRGETSF